MGFAIGKVPRGKDYFARPDITDRLWRIIEAGEHVLLLAPRRFGKSGTLYFMEDKPKPGWDVRTWMLQNLDKPSDLISLILAELLKVSRRNWSSTPLWWTFITIFIFQEMKAVLGEDIYNNMLPFKTAALYLKTKDASILERLNHEERKPVDLILEEINKQKNKSSE